MSNDENDYPSEAIVCLPVDGPMEQSVVPGSEQRACDQCNCLVWISPTGIDNAIDNGWAILCWDCGMSNIRKQMDKEGVDFDPDQALQVVPGALEEVAQWTETSVDKQKSLFSRFRDLFRR